MREIEEIWEVLEIDPTDNVREIKKAYAKLIARYHPEEYPEKFQEIYSAYEIALKMAKGKSVRGTEELGEEPGEEQRQTGADLESGSGFRGAGRPWDEPETENPEWLQAEEISRLAREYEIKNAASRRREQLYAAFVQDMAKEQMPKITRTDQLQDHDAWCRFFENKVVLEAIKYEGFMTTLYNRILPLRFRAGTLQMMDAVLEEKVPMIYAKQEKLRRMLREEGQKKARKELLKHRLAPFVVAALLILVCGSVYFISEHLRTARAVQEYHSVKNIEAYIEHKYNIKCTLEQSVTDGMNDNLSYTTKSDQDKVFYAATTWEPVAGEMEFHLRWTRNGEDYMDIEDDYAYQLKKAYAPVYDLELGMSLTGAKGVQIGDTPLNEFASNFFAYLHALSQSDYVQSGHDISVSVETTHLGVSTVTVKLNRYTPIDEAGIRVQLEEAVEKYSTLDTQQETP